MSLTRREFYSRIGLLRKIDPLTSSAYQFSEWLEQQKPNVGAGVDTPWHLSFHGSSFPGTDPYACGRKALYSMMDIPRAPFSRTSRQVMDAGKDIEVRLVQAWYNAGYLLSPPPGDLQLQLEDRDVWLTSTVDALVLHPEENRPEVVEIKTKYAADLQAMLHLYRGPDPKHIAQLKCQIGLAHKQLYYTVNRCHNSGRLAVNLGKLFVGGGGIEICPEHRHNKCLKTEQLERVESGHIYYVSRDKPSDTCEFYFEHDPQFMEAGKRKLGEWRKWFETGALPQSNFSTARFSHPFNWQWTKEEFPCKWCDYGDICRADHKQASELGHPIDLSESAGIEAAKTIRADYDFDLVRAAVETRWENKVAS
jgi:hypothetical protein